MKCSQAIELIPLHSTNDLDLSLIGELENHLEACAECCEMHSVFQADRQLLNDVASEVRVDLWSSLEPHLDAIDASRRIRRPWYRRTTWVAAAAVLVFGGISFLNQPSPQTNNQPDVAADLALNDSPQKPASGSLQAVPHSELMEYLGRSNGVLHKEGRPPALLATPASSTAREF